MIFFIQIISDALFSAISYFFISLQAMLAILDWPKLTQPEIERKEEEKEKKKEEKERKRREKARVGGAMSNETPRGASGGAAQGATGRASTSKEKRAGTTTVDGGSGATGDCVTLKETRAEARKRCRAIRFWMSIRFTGTKHEVRVSLFH